MINAFLYLDKYFSSHSIVVTSKWLVGSSSISKSGFERISLINAIFVF